MVHFFILKMLLAHDSGDQVRSMTAFSVIASWLSPTHCPQGFDISLPSLCTVRSHVDAEAWNIHMHPGPCLPQTLIASNAFDTPAWVLSPGSGAPRTAQFPFDCASTVLHISLPFHCAQWPILFVSERIRHPHTLWSMVRWRCYSSYPFLN